MAKPAGDAGAEPDSVDEGDETDNPGDDRAALAPGENPGEWANEASGDADNTRPWTDAAPSKSVDDID